MPTNEDQPKESNLSKLKGKIRRLPIRFKFKILLWLCPGLVAEVDRLRHMSEAMHDILVLGVPYSEAVYYAAFQNVVSLEPDYMARKVSIQDRQASLLEIYRRS